MVVLAGVGMFLGMVTLVAVGVGGIGWAIQRKTRRKNLEVHSSGDPRYGEAYLRTGEIPRVIDEHVVDAELVLEVEEAVNAFLDDPLGSWCPPPELELDTPLAGEAFNALVESGNLTGAGMDIDTEWREWNLKMEELVTV